jgi:hypothetical protein
MLSTVAAILLSGCGATMGAGEAGCVSYGIARATMPPPDTVPAGAWGQWVADTDDRMTGACR